MHWDATPHLQPEMAREARAFAARKARATYQNGVFGVFVRGTLGGRLGGVEGIYFIIFIFINGLR